MRSSSIAAVAVPFAARAVAGQYDDWKFGNMFNIGLASSAIAKASWSLVPPPVPCGTVTEDKSAQPWMSIWVGISQSLSDQGTDLFQPLLNWAPNNAQEGCPASNSEWCMAASTYTGAGIQVAQSYVVIPNKSDLDFELTHDSAKGVTQKVWINGALVSQQTDKDTNGKAPTYVFSSNECYKGTCGTVQSHWEFNPDSDASDKAAGSVINRLFPAWSNLTITLTEADANFGKTL